MLGKTHLILFSLVVIGVPGLLIEAEPRVSFPHYLNFETFFTSIHCYAS